MVEQIPFPEEYYGPLDDSVGPGNEMNKAYSFAQLCSMAEEA